MLHRRIDIIGHRQAYLIIPCLHINMRLRAVGAVINSVFVCAISIEIQTTGQRIAICIIDSPAESYNITRFRSIRARIKAANLW